MPNIQNTKHKTHADLDDAICNDSIRNYKSLDIVYLLFSLLIILANPPVHTCQPPFSYYPPTEVSCLIKTVGKIRYNNQCYDLFLMMFNTAVILVIVFMNRRDKEYCKKNTKIKQYFLLLSLLLTFSGQIADRPGN